MIPVLIENETGQQITFGEYKPPSRTGNAQLFTVTHRRLDAPTKERLVEFLLLCCEATDHDLRFRVEQSATEEPFFMVANVHGLAVGRLARDFGDLARVHPAMASAQTSVFAGFEDDRRRDDTIPVCRVVPPAWDDVAAYMIDSKPGATTAEDLWFDALLDEKALVAKSRASLAHVIRARRADDDTKAAAAFRGLDDKWFV